MVRVGIVAEGPSDWLVLEEVWLVLEEVMRAVYAEIEFVRLQPDYTMTSLGQGWRGVRAWCQENGPRLDLIMTGIPGRILHLLIIHADCSMADKAGVEHPCPPASDTAIALGKIIEVEWLGRDPKPDFVVIATPSQSSDAWAIATFDPPYANLAGIECDKWVEDEFVRRKFMKRKDGQVKKSAKRYEPIAARIGQAIDLVCHNCTQAETFRSDFRVAVARILPH